MSSLDSVAAGKGNVSLRRVLLELHAPGLREEESVRVSGSTAELGEWHVHRSKPLTKRDG